MIKLGILIGTLQIGGSELQLLQLLENIDRTRFEPVVFTLSSAGPLDYRIKRLRIEVFPLNIRKNTIITSLINFYQVLRTHNIDILYC